MIKIEHVVTASPEQLEFIIEGMRNPMNSWDKSDSYIGCCGYPCEDCECNCRGSEFAMGIEDMLLMKKLSKAGTDHRKFMRMMQVYMRITAPLYWWKEFDTYKVGVTPNPNDIESNSCSTMHKIHAKEFTKDDFSREHLDVRAIAILENIIKTLNDYRELYINYDPDDFEVKGCPSKKDIWWQIIQLLPSSYNQTRNLMLNYESLANIYKSRKNHKLDEWRTICEFIEALPYSSIITGIEYPEVTR